jgi:hyperosmotically inducible protein
VRQSSTHAHAPKVLNIERALPSLGRRGVTVARADESTSGYFSTNQENPTDMRNTLAISAGVALLALTAACGGEPTTNSTVNRGNTNTAVVTNSNANANTNATANANTTAARNDNWNWNANREDFDKNANNWRASASNAGDKISTEAGDGWIHFKVRGALFAADDLRDSTINVDVEKGVVTLRGSVANAAQKTKAGQAAKVDGAKSVTNNLVVKADGDANKNANTANANKKG